MIEEEPQLSIYNDGTLRDGQSRNICLAFTVEDMDAAYQKVLALSAEVIDPPTKRPWGTINMRFYDPDRNEIYLREFPKD